MKKLFSYLIFFIVIVNPSYACDLFSKIKFGDGLKEINKDIPFPLFKDNFGGEKLVVPIEEICKNSKLNGSFVSYLFLEGKLSQVFIERAHMKDVNLMEYSKEKYGPFALPAEINPLDWRGSHFWSQKNVSIHYLQINIHEGKLELLEFNSKKYEENLIKYSKAIGEWLDQSN